MLVSTAPVETRIASVLSSRTWKLASVSGATRLSVRFVPTMFCAPSLLLLGAHVYLAAIDRDANLRLPAALGGRVLGDGDYRVGLDEEVRAVGERDAGAAVLLRLDDVAGEETRVRAGLQRLARVGAHDLHAAFERDEARARGGAYVVGHALQGVAVQVDV